MCAGFRTLMSARVRFFERERALVRVSNCHKIAVRPDVPSGLNSGQKRPCVPRLCRVPHRRPPIRRGFPNSFRGCRRGSTPQKAHSPCQRRCGSLLFAIPSAVGSDRLDRRGRPRRKTYPTHVVYSRAIHIRVIGSAYVRPTCRKTEALRRAGSRPSGFRYL